MRRTLSPFIEEPVSIKKHAQIYHEGEMEIENLLDYAEDLEIGNLLNHAEDSKIEDLAKHVSHAAELGTVTWPDGISFEKLMNHAEDLKIVDLANHVSCAAELRTVTLPDGMSLQSMWNPEGVLVDVSDAKMIEEGNLETMELQVELRSYLVRKGTNLLHSVEESEIITGAW